MGVKKYPHVREIQGMNSETEKIQVMILRDGIMIEDRDTGGLIGSILLAWKEWEEVDKFIKEVRIGE
ncbi:MAG: hypothetical protein DRP09_16135 [Candidatus Thorarchaeota archaeon]|nr:MAG: hypothetical protein DRP09_16135 [Candidatus Thorarchaeota archaeon]